MGNPRLSYLAGDRGRPRLDGALGGKGIVTVIRDMGIGDRFRGQTPFVDGEVDTDVERYLTDSEQIDSAVGCEVFANESGTIRYAAGILVQALPGGLGTDVVAAARARLRSGEVAHTLAARLDEEGEESITTTVVAAATLGSDVASLAQLGDSRPIRFFCPCSPARAAATLAMLGERELVSMIEEDGRGEVTCEFCRNKYQFTDEDLETIRRGLHATAPPPS